MLVLECKGTQIICNEYYIFHEFTLKFLFYMARGIETNHRRPDLKNLFVPSPNRRSSEKNLIGTIPPSNGLSQVVKGETLPAGTPDLPSALQAQEMLRTFEQLVPVLPNAFSKQSEQTVFPTDIQLSLLEDAEAIVNKRRCEITAILKRGNIPDELAVAQYDPLQDDWALESHIRRNHPYLDPTSLTPEQISNYRDELIQKDETYNPADYEETETPEVREPGAVLSKYLRREHESALAYQRRVKNGLEELNGAIMEANRDSQALWYKAKGKSRHRAGAEAEHLGEAIGNIYNDILKAKQEGATELEFVDTDPNYTIRNQIIGIVGQQEVPGYGEKQKKKQGFWSRFLFGERDIDEVNDERIEKDFEVKGRLETFLVQEAAVNATVAPLLAKRETGIPLSEPELKQWKKDKLDTFYDRWGDVRSKLDADFWERPENRKA